MNTDEAERIVRACLGEVAPESPFDEVSRDADLRAALSLDSLDFLSLVELLSERIGVRIDEEDYPQLATVRSAASFLTAAAAGQAR